MNGESPFLTFALPARHLVAAQQIVFFSGTVDPRLYDMDTVVLEVGRREVRVLSTDSYCFLLSRSLDDAQILWSTKGDLYCPDKEKPLRLSVPTTYVRAFRNLFKGSAAKGNTLIEVFPDLRVRISNSFCIDKLGLSYNGPPNPPKTLSVIIEAKRLSKTWEALDYTVLLYEWTRSDWDRAVFCDPASVSKLLRAKRTLLEISPKTPCFLKIVAKAGNLCLVPIGKDAFGGFSKPVMPAHDSEEDRIVYWAMDPAS